MQYQLIGHIRILGIGMELDGAILPAWDYPLCPKRNSVLFPCNKSFIDQACQVNMAGYWPHSYFACLWTLTPSRSITMQKDNLANIQLSNDLTLGQ